MSERAEGSRKRSVCSNDNGGVQRRQSPEVHRLSVGAGDLKGDKDKAKRTRQGGSMRTRHVVTQKKAKSNVSGREDLQWEEHKFEQGSASAACVVSL